MTSVYLRGAHGALIVYDISRPATFDTVFEWAGMVTDTVILQNGKPLPIVMIGNKSDLETAAVDAVYMARVCTEHNFVAWKDTSAVDRSNPHFAEAVKWLVDSILCHTDIFGKQCSGLGSAKARKMKERAKERKHALEFTSGATLPASSCC